MASSQLLVFLSSVLNFNFLKLEFMSGLLNSIHSFSTSLSNEARNNIYVFSTNVFAVAGTSELKEERMALFSNFSKPLAEQMLQINYPSFL